MTENTYITTILNKIEKNAATWISPAAIAYKKWAKDIIEKFPSMLKSYEVLFLHSMQLGAVPFSLENREKFRAITRRLPAQSSLVWDSLTPWQKEYAKDNSNCPTFSIEADLASFMSRETGSIDGRTLSQHHRR